MNVRNLSVRACLAAAGIVGVFGLGALVGSATAADTTKDVKAAGQPEMKLPPGWTEADMQACLLASTPGKMHQELAKGVGTWQGKTTMWMGPGSEPMKSECTAKITSIMDGRYTKCDWDGEMPGMGPYQGAGIYGYDNVSQKFVSTWIDSQSTGIMQGTGDLSADHKTLTWNYTYNCPVNKKPAVMREVEKTTGDNTKTLEMFGADPKSGKEYKMMSIELTRK